MSLKDQAREQARRLDTLQKRIDQAKKDIKRLEDQLP